jgi:hypothetical protein
MIDSFEIIRFFTSFRMTITAFLPIATQSLKGEVRKGMGMCGAI